jgi:photosynthetic reaction center H subunit
MFSGLTSSIDLAEILFTLFWVFFVLLVLYLHREGKREGYPLVSDRSDRVTVQGFPAVPEPKTYTLQDGSIVLAPDGAPPEVDVAAVPAANFPGAPLVPTGDPMIDGVGAASWGNRADKPDLMLDGRPRVVPLRTQPDVAVSSRDRDPRGMTVVAADGVDVGTVSDLWMDLAEPQIYYLEVDMKDGGGTTILPFHFADMRKRPSHIRVNAIYSHQFANVPRLKHPDQITLLEEDKITAYYAGGELYADPQRAEPFL